MRVLQFAVGPFQANAYLAICEATGRCAIVDPGADPDRLLTAVDEEGVEVEMIVLTHAHLDHVGAVGPVHSATGAPIYLHPADRGLYDAAPQQAQSFGFELPPPPPPNHALAEGEVLDVGEATLEVRHTPGHSPGHVTLVGEGFAFVGDCVFAGSIGRSDLPGGDARLLLRSIHEKILTLPDTAVLYPGHGPPTRVGQERRSNPFLVEASGWST